MESIYLLELKGYKYYVGKTDRDIDERFQEHLDGEGSAWTCLHKPIKVLKKYKSYNLFDEDKYVFWNMSLYGIDNVRGGSFSQVELTPEESTVLTKILRHGSGACLACGSFEHFASECESCTRCGRDSHKVEKCYAKKHLDGTVLDERR